MIVAYFVSCFVRRRNRVLVTKISMKRYRAVPHIQLYRIYSPRKDEGVWGADEEKSKLMAQGAYDHRVFVVERNPGPL